MEMNSNFCWREKSCLGLKSGCCISFHTSGGDEQELVEPRVGLLAVKSYCKLTVEVLHRFFPGLKK